MLPNNMFLLKLKKKQEFNFYTRQNTLKFIFRCSTDLKKTPKTWATVRSAVECLAAFFSQLDSLAAPGGNNYPTDSY